MSRSKILFVKHYKATAKFINNDAEILREKYDVEIYKSYVTKNIFTLFSLLKQSVFLLVNIKKYSLIYIWFADYHAFLPILFGKIFKKKSVIAVGGYDATDIPEIECGVFSEKNFLKRIRRFAAQYSFKHCNKIFVVDDSLIENENTYIYSDIPNSKPLKDGILNFIPEVKNKMEVVYFGFDKTFFKRDENSKKENFVLSVGYSDNDNEFKRKGFDELVKVSKVLKNVNFVIIGLNSDQLDRLNKLELTNVKFLPPAKLEDLMNYFDKAKVFVQLSLFEGQPNTLVESMMYECIPVGSDVNGIPRVIGDTGFIVYKKDINEIAEKILLALSAPEDLGKAARERVIKNYPIEKRREKILNIVSELLNS